VTIVAEKSESTVATLREAPGKDVWLFGGGSLFRSLLEAGLVDTVEVGVIPVPLGEGIPLLPPPARQAKLKLRLTKGLRPLKSPRASAGRVEIEDSSRAGI
jgi:dihydrofolate reductase